MIEACNVDCSLDNCSWGCLDGDGDGYGIYPANDCMHREPDCNDLHPWVHPGAEEVCDSFDTDCSGLARAEIAPWEKAPDTSPAGRADSKCRCADPNLAEPEPKRSRVKTPRRKGRKRS